MTSRSGSSKRFSRLADRPIGIFDSGIGGLTVARAVCQVLPNEEIVYFGDTARVPYGTKSKSSIIRFSRQNVAFLKRERVKMVVIACNSSASLAFSALRRAFDLPMVDVISPGVRRAVETTQNKRVGVIATPATIASGAYERQIKRLSSSISVISHACPLFVPLVEEGWLNHPVTEQVAEEYCANIKKYRVDTLVLGCTHYPLLKAVLRKVMGTDVVLVDSAQETARAVARALARKGLLYEGKRKKPRHRFFVSDESVHFREAARRFIGENIRAERVEIG